MGCSRDSSYGRRPHRVVVSRAGDRGRSQWTEHAKIADIEGALAEVVQTVHDLSEGLKAGVDGSTLQELERRFVEAERVWHDALRRLPGR